MIVGLARDRVIDIAKSACVRYQIWKPQRRVARPRLGEKLKAGNRDCLRAIGGASATVGQSFSSWNSPSRDVRSSAGQRHPLRPQLRTSNSLPTRLIRPAECREAGSSGMSPLGANLRAAVALEAAAAPGLLPEDLGPEVVGQGSEFNELLLQLA